MQWKERTIKSDWKWRFTAQVFLVLSICLSVGVTCFLFLFITPSVMYLFVQTGEEFPDHLKAIWNIGDLLIARPYLVVTLVVALAGLFEWKCQSENKTLIRTAMLAVVSLISAAVAFVVIFAYLIHIVLLAVAQQPG